MANKTKKPSLTNQHKSNPYPLIPQTDKNNLKYLTFSFRYFSEADLFGVGDADSSRFKNLYDRLTDLSGKTAAILEDKIEREAYRLHNIDWIATACPIQIDDLVRVPKEIRDSAKEDFFWQFQLSKGTGRVVGFFNQDYSIFYIVLLDFKHNIQPSKDYGYAVNNTEFAMTEYEQLQAHILDLESKRIKCKNLDNCPLETLNMHISTDTVFVNVDPELAKVYSDLLKDGTFTERFNDFLLGNL